MKNVIDKISEINSLIPDKNIQNIVFNFGQNYPSFLSDESRCISYFSNIMVFTSILVMNAFYKWKSDNGSSISDSHFSNSFIRMFNMLNRSYDSTKINNDYIDDLIINLEIDCLLQKSISNSFVSELNISSFFNFSDKNSNLSTYIYMLKQKRISSRFVADFGYEELIDCINMFPFLKSSNVKLYQNEIYKNKLFGIKFFSNIPNSLSDIDLKYSFLKKDNTIFYLEDFNIYDPKKLEDDRIKNQILQLNYGSLDSPDCFSIVLTDKYTDKLSKTEYLFINNTIIEDFLIDYDIINNPSEHEANIFFKDYFSLNNGYIKFLSLSVSDTISVDTKKAILKKYKNKYIDFFKKMYVVSLFNNNREIGYRWDEIILYLFLEEGIYDFIYFLLSFEKYQSFIASFKRRFDETKVDKIFNSDKFISNPEKNIQYLSENNKKDCEARALIMLATRLFDNQELPSEKNYYPITIDDTIKEIIRVYNSHIWQNREKILYILNSSFQILRFITAFYSGFLEYAKWKKEFELQKENSYLKCNDSLINNSKYTDYVKNKKKWINNISKMFIINKQKNSEYNSINSKLEFENIFKSEVKKLEKAFENICDFNNNICKRKYSDNEALLYSMGKNKLFKNQDMDNFRQSIINIANKYSYENNILDELYVETISFFNYLKFGTKHFINKELYMKNAIYPLVGKCYQSAASCDGYHSSIFKFNCFNYNSKLINENVQFSVKMITDDIFDFGCSYYCIPNNNTITSVNNKLADYIWLNPIVIRCSLFTPRNIVEIEILNDKNDFDDAIELIYQSDEYVYNKLFGSINNAKMVMPNLFENPRSKFYKKHYHILRKDNKIVAIAALYGSKCYNSNYNHQWNTSIITDAYISNNLKIPSEFDSAIEYLEIISHDIISSNYYYIDDVCVRKEYRNQGVGKSLLMNLIKKADENDYGIMLTVYRDNIIAKRLYDSVGFIPYTKETDNNNIFNKKYYRMVKI